MAIDGYYYLHENGELIYRRALPGIEADFRESSLVRAFWPCDPEDRETAWTTLVEALAAGANKSRVAELAAKWHCTDEDAKVFAQRVGCIVRHEDPSPNPKGPIYATRADFVNIQESPNGWGDTALEAMAELAKELGYKPAKMWGHTFKSLLAAPAAKAVR